MEKPYYVLNTAEILPRDIDYNEPRSQIQANYYFRPEFLCNYDTALKSDIGKDYIGYQFSYNVNKQQEYQKVSEANQFLKTEVLEHFVNHLNDLKALPIDSESLTKTMHQHGINLRYLSHIAIMSQVQHVVDICINEMVARTCKNILYHQLGLMISENQTEFHDLLKQKEKMKETLREKQSQPDKRLYMMRGSSSESLYDEDSARHEAAQMVKDIELIDLEIDKRLNRNMDRKVQKGVVDMLNLIFGKSKETQLFWSNMLAECDRKFHVSEALDFHLQKGILHLERVEDLLAKSKINLNALFFAL